MVVMIVTITNNLSAIVTCLINNDAERHVMIALLLEKYYFYSNLVLVKPGKLPKAI